MEQITQLKQMRDDSLARLQYNPDYKLLIALDRLIRDLDHLVKGETSSSLSGSVLPMVNKEKNKGELSSSDLAETNSDLSDELDAAFSEITEEKPQDSKSDKDFDKKMIFSSGFNDDKSKAKSFKQNTA